MVNAKKKCRFIAFEGADGVGKSTVMKRLLPKLMEIGDYTGYAFFHWKPVKNGFHEGCIPHDEPHNPRGSHPRSRFMSLIYLIYHWISFQTGYWLRVRPAMRMGKLVIADRYAYDMLADQRRFRLNVPAFLMRIFLKTLPAPDTMLLLVADPGVITARKLELSESEVSEYQEIMKKIETRARVCIVDASPLPEAVADAALKALDFM